MYPISHLFVQTPNSQFKKEKKTTFLFQDPDASYDFNSNDADPEPRPTWNDENRLVTQHVLTDEKLLKFSI